MPNRLRDGDGREVRLGRQLGSGGEGVVYELQDRREFVAKLYHRPAGLQKAEKLAAMSRVATTSLLNVAAWPTSTLHKTSESSLVGLIMPKIVGFLEVHRLYSPAHRKCDFSRADWAFGIRTARNLAAAFDSIHSCGHVVGDVNQGNVVVSQQAVVKFIDCDSFQIALNGTTYPCEVGVGHFTPPELQGKSFNGVLRSANHDAFGLAVLCFHLLFMGRHPFAGKFHGAGDMPIERAIREFRFAFSRKSASREMTPPPFALRLDSVPSELGSLFERAFGQEGAGQRRPLPREWIGALDALENGLTTCPAHRGHRYYRDLQKCPWCDIEQHGGPDFFISLATFIRSATVFDLNLVWKQITGIPAPLLSPSPPAQHSIPAATPVPSVTRRWRVASEAVGWSTLFPLLGSSFEPPVAIGAAAVLGILAAFTFFVSPYGSEYRRRRSDAKQAGREAELLVSRWRQELGAFSDRFTQKKRELEQNKSQYEMLLASYQAERDALNARAVDSQRKDFLQKYFIDRAHLRGIGPSLTAALASYGIDTAADITASAVEGVPGFGPSRIQLLLKWRASLEKNFRYDPRRGVAPADLAVLDKRHAGKRTALESGLAGGVGTLQRIASAAEAQRLLLIKEAQEKFRHAERARADLGMLRLPSWWSIWGVVAVVVVVILSAVTGSFVTERLELPEWNRQPTVSPPGIEREISRGDSMRRRSFGDADADGPVPGNRVTAPLEQQATQPPAGKSLVLPKPLNTSECTKPATPSLVLNDGGVVIGDLVDTEMHGGRCFYMIETGERTFRVVDASVHRILAKDQ